MLCFGTLNEFETIHNVVHCHVESRSVVKYILHKYPQVAMMTLMFVTATSTTTRGERIVVF